MLPSEYCRLAQRTECDQIKAIKRLTGSPGAATCTTDTKAVRVCHGVVGLTGEVGELSAVLEKWIWYGQELDLENVVEEVGDLCWYIALICNALGVDLGVVMEKNIAKLRARYPARYSNELAAERDLLEEKRAMAAISKVQALLPLPEKPPPPDEVVFTTAAVEPINGLVQVVRGEASQMFEGKVCERCSEPATRIVHDTSVDYSLDEAHWFCSSHDRPAKVLYKDSK